MTNPPNHDNNNAEDRMSSSSNQSRFRFLTAAQVLQMTKLSSRQALPEALQPQPRQHVIDDNEDALAFVFVSHRWFAPNQADDAQNSQLQCLQKWLRYVQDLLEVVATQRGAKLIVDEDDDTTCWPKHLTDMVEGMPQAVSLVSRLQPMLEREMKKKDASPVLDDPLNFIYLWYDCSCLPQKFPHGRTEAERDEFAWALQHLDQLAQQCHMVVLESEDYQQRAWCGFEFFTKFIDADSVHPQSHLTLPCHQVLQRQRVDWGVHNTAAKEGSTQNVYANVQETELGNNQTFWNVFLSRVDDAGGRFKKYHHLKQDNNPPPQPKEEDGVEQQQQQQVHHKVKNQDLQTPAPWRKLIPTHAVDLTLGRHRIHNAKAHTPPMPTTPMAQAVTCLARELCSVVFYLSCRDISQNVSANCNSCPDGCPLQCGLHNHGHNARPLNEQQELLQDCVATAWKKTTNLLCQDAAALNDDTMKEENGASSSPLPFCLQCPNGHGLQPSVATLLLRCSCDASCQLSGRIASGSFHATCSEESCCQDEEEKYRYRLCYTCATTKAGVDRTRTHPRFSKKRPDGWDTLVQACQTKVAQNVESLSTEEEERQQRNKSSWKPKTCPKDGTLLVPILALPASVSVTPCFLQCHGDRCILRQQLIVEGTCHVTCPCCDKYHLCYQCALAGCSFTKINPIDSLRPQGWDHLVQAYHLKPMPNDDKRKTLSTTTTTTLCERRLTVDLFALANSILERFGLRCTNQGDVAFVGLLALKNLLLMSASRNENNDTSTTAKTTTTLPKKSALQVSAGSLSLLQPMIQDALELYSNMLALGDGRDVTSLKVTISLQVPRWVLLDLAQTSLDHDNVDSALITSKYVLLPQNVRKFFTQHPECISHSFDTNEPALPHNFCSQQCNYGGWSPCSHQIRTDTMALQSLSPDTTLDPWVTLEQSLPFPLVAFCCATANRRVYLISGANGEEEDNQKGAYTKCLPHTLISSPLPFSTETTWHVGPNVNKARRNHAVSVQCDTKNNKEMALWISGGRGSGDDGCEGELLSSIEVLRLKDTANDKNNHGASWELLTDTSLPQPR